jgi:UDP-N-acetylmuramoylalanine-D-glutamate ligase
VRPRPAVPAGPYLVAGVGQAGAAAARALVRHSGADAVRLWDGLGTQVQRDAAEVLTRIGVRTHHGGDGLALLGAALGAVIKSPGLAADTPLLVEAARRGIPVLDEAELGWRLDPRPVVAVTGTNGKSTTAALASAILTAAGSRPVLAGNTTFGVPLSAASQEPGDVIVAELSSFQLEACPALLPEAAVLTNLTEDHLYRHGTLEAYAACKRRLLVREEAVAPVAAIGVDQAFGRAVARELRERGSRVVTFGADRSADRRVLSSPSGLGGGPVVITEGAGTRTLRTQLTGAHNALNAAGALALADALGLDPALAARAIEQVGPLPGRYERFRSGTGFDVVVDFAHNPDGVEQALRAGRAVVDAREAGRLRVVLSTLSFVGDEQARGVGRVGAALADQLVLTTQCFSQADAPGQVPAGLLEGAAGAAHADVQVEPDREVAIASAVGSAVAGDLVLILDRGSRTTPLFDAAGSGRPFDDRAEVRRHLARLGGPG